MKMNEFVTKKTRKRNIVVFVITNVLIIGVLALLWTQLTTPTSNATHSPDEQLVTVGDVSSPLVGKAAPAFELPYVQENGKKVRLADFKGQPVVLNFWASWCDPCNREAPLLQTTALDLKAKGVVFLGVDGGEPTSAGQRFLQKYGVTYTNIADSVGGATAISYGVTNMPETFFIDRNGKVVARYTGELDARNLQQELAKLQVN